MIIHKNILIYSGFQQKSAGNSAHVLEAQLFVQPDGAVIAVYHCIEDQQCAPLLRNIQVSRMRQVAQPRAPFFSGCAESPISAVTDFRGIRMCYGVTVSPRRFCASSSCKICGCNSRGKSP